DQVRRSVLAGLGEMPFGPSGPALNVRPVSRHQRKNYVIENVLFESLPGCDVNASVYLPLVKDHPPPWPAVVVPVGHSGKQFENYQVPAQVFARLGYVAVTFDPPGMAGEKRAGNDHFSDGVRCYLTGRSSNRYFVIDAIRCIDYLATRKDVDMSHGVGMTGVSGGGTTTMFATLLDERIRAAGPSCCAVPNAYHPVLDCYAPCAETLAAGRFAEGLDDVDLLAAAMPTPLLLMAGQTDEVFKIDWSRRIAADVKTAYQKSGSPDRFRFFPDKSGHAYTVAQAVEFAKWMDKWVRGKPGRKLPEVKRPDFEMVPPEMLKCNPRQEGNIFTINQALAQHLRTHRSGLAVRDAAMRVAHIEKPPVAPKHRGGGRSLVWFHDLEELLLLPEPGIELPATLMIPARKGWKGGAVLYFDDRGRWTDLARQGMLAQMTGFIDEETNGPAILTVDLRGWGDTTPAYVPYEIAGWGDRQRWMSYVSAAMGDHVLAMRIRDGLSALAYLRAHSQIDPKKIVIGGHGMGGVVALHVAAIDGGVAGVFSAEGLASFESLATSPSYAWSHEDFLPHALEHYDLPELLASLTMPTLIVNSLDASRKPLEPKASKEMYAGSLKRGKAFELQPAVDQGRSRNLQVEFVRRLAR
ncbi:MAG: hypothetical protein JXQ73_08660, partial [Phycisphaerae bacterium]|nr:hypothetical protein [Phycisphaerae bacterium]